MRFWIAAFLFCSSPLLALYNGNPSLPDMPELGLWISNDDWWGFKVGYEWDDTFEKRVKVVDRVSSRNDRYDGFHAMKNIGTLTFNVIDRFEFYTFLGAMKIDLSQRPVRGTRLEYQTKRQMAWGLGGRIILVYWEKVVMGVNALYTGSHLTIDRILDNGIPRRSSGARLKYYEWQVGISFSREIGPLIPYLGIAYASMRSNLYNVPLDASFPFQIADEDLKNREPFILILGTGLTKGQFVSFNLESRLVGEKALTLSGHIRF
ncbi:MAG: hypothetical protein K1060chlam2_00522 [Chlamydiae bacterium]|nr:hypothetical protein [Chlamydiota bacterium]